MTEKPRQSSEKGTSAHLRSFKRPPVHLYPKSEGKEEGSIRSLPEVVDFNARYNPEHMFCIQARKQKSSNSTAVSLFHLTNVHLRDAVLRCAKWLRQNVKEMQLPTTQSDAVLVKGQPVALLMESDVCLWIYQLALMGLGVPVLLLSARLGVTAIGHLVKKTSTNAIIASPRFQETVRQLLENPDQGCELTTLYCTANFDTLVSLDTPAESASVCYADCYLNAVDRDVLILHSSGTTGLPKPIPVSHRHLLSFLSCHNFSDEIEAQGLNLSTLPLYHGFGLLAPSLAMGVGKTVCLPAAATVPSASSVIELLHATKSSSLMSVPSILEDISLMPEEFGAQALAHLDFVTFGGGLLKEVVGARLSSSGVRILNHYGTTESGPLSLIFVPKPDYDWRYFRLRKDIRIKIDSIERSDGARRFKLTTYPFGWSKPFEIQDELECNPLHPDTDFTATGRKDDLIVLATGEKVQPQILENTLTNHELVKTAVAFGDGQFEIGVIVQPFERLPPGTELDFKTEIWPTILKAGSMMDDFARVTAPEAIIVVSSDKNIPRTDKGSIARREVFKKFEKEITAVYAQLEYSTANSITTTFDMTKLELQIRKFVQRYFPWAKTSAEWSDNDDLFALGMDSLQAVRLRRFLSAGITQNTHSLPVMRLVRDFVYLNPSIIQMAEAIRGLEKASTGYECTSEAEINELVTMYRLPEASPEKRPLTGKVVLMTGGTGSLGAHAVAKFAQQSNITKVVCLNRLQRSHGDLKQDGLERQQSSFASKGIILTPEARAKIEVIETDTADTRLGLAQEQYDNLCNSVTDILHNAWPMDFKLKLSSFKSQFESVRNLLLLAIDIRQVRPSSIPRFFFISSIATVGQYPISHGGCIVPEVPVISLNEANEIGYAQAKLVCEKLVQHAAHHYVGVIEASIVRLGQISGSSVTGCWNTEEHFAALVKSAQHIKVTPELPGTFAWMPVDRAAAVICELLLATGPPALIYHIDNPVRQSWADAMSTIGSALGIARSMPLQNWLDTVCAATGSSVSSNPAQKLESFFRSDFLRMACGQVILGTDAARGVSSTLCKMDVIPANVIVSHIKYWRRIGFLE